MSPKEIAASDERSLPPSKSSPAIDVSDARRLVVLTLRFAISSKDYAFLRRKIATKGLRSRTPTAAEFDAIANAPDSDDYLPAASRAGLRTFLISNILLNSWEAVSSRLGKNKA